MIEKYEVAIVNVNGDTVSGVDKKHETFHDAIMDASQRSRATGLKIYIDTDLPESDDENLNSIVIYVL